MSDEAQVHGSTTARLVYMANQIATYFASQPGSVAPASTADHIKSFWTLTMLRDVYKHLDVGGDGLESGGAGDHSHATDPHCS